MFPSSHGVELARLQLQNVGIFKIAPEAGDSKHLTVTSSDSGAFQHLTLRFWIAFRDALVTMIIVSDNTCTGTVVDLVELADIQRYCDAVGLKGTTHRFGIPPRLGPDVRSAS